MKYLMRIMNVFLPDCEEISHLTSQAMDEPLPWRKRLGMRLHIMFCAFCRRNAEHLRLMRILIQQKLRSREPAVGAGDSLSPEARQRITRALTQPDSDRSV